MCASASRTTVTCGSHGQHLGGPTVYSRAVALTGDATGGTIPVIPIVAGAVLLLLGAVGADRGFRRLRARANSDRSRVSGDEV